MSTLSRVLRLAPRCQFGKVLNKNQLGMLQAIRPVTFRVEPAKPIENLDYDEKNMDLKRPLSPHIAIYSLQSQMVLSISHRIAGAAMASYLIGFGLGSLALPEDISTYIEAIDGMSIPAPLLFTARFLLILPFAYHSLNGLRHLVWDMGKLLYIRQVLASGYVILGSAILVGLSLAS